MWKDNQKTIPSNGLAQSKIKSESGVNDIIDIQSFFSIWRDGVEKNQSIAMIKTYSHIYTGVSPTKKNFVFWFYWLKSTVIVQKLDTWQRKIFLPPLGVRGAPWVKIGGF